jgi:hypothetical protein
VSAGTRYGLAKRRQLALVLPVDLQYLQSSGTVSEALRPFFGAATLEGAQLTLAYEGEAGTPGHRALSAPRKALLEEYLRAGLIMRGELARYAQTQDPDAGSRAITAMGRRSAILEKLGLENAEHEVDLSTYLAQKASQDSTGAPPGGVEGTNSTEEDPQPLDAEKVPNSDGDDPPAADARKGASVAPGGGAPGREVVRPASAAVSFTTQDEED